MAPSTHRRVSYVVPSSPTAPPYLSLPSPTHPRNGSPHPILLPSTARQHSLPSSSSQAPSIAAPSHPQHSLGVPALALDSSTQLAGKDTPQGLLYTGGRDGLVASWELGIGMKRRKRRIGYGEGGERGGWVKWDDIEGGGGDDDEFDEFDEAAEDENWEDLKRAEEEEGKQIPYEDRWEPDGEIVQKPTSNFRQCVQYHTDWVSDLVLANLNQTVISASSDRTIRAWNPHSPEEALHPTVIGEHQDYVRCLAYSCEQRWVASGGLDRQIKIWDLTRSSGQQPLLNLNSSETKKEKSSIYALATTPSGNLVAAGSPERVVKIYDPRAGGKRIAKLVGHTDNIRSLLISEDGKYLLSGSSDTTVKLWSMAAQRVLHTFTHHADPVWSLFSSHPNLERFYSGDRKGNIAIVDMERCSDVSEGECILLSSSASSDPSSSPTSSTFPSSQNDPSTSKQPNPLANRSCMGINKIVAMDDAYVWASTSSSSVSMWKDVGKRTKRSPGFRPNGMLDEDPFDQQQDEEDDEPFQMDGMEPATAGGYVPSPSAVPRSGSLRNFDAARSSSPSDPPLPTASYHNKRLSFDFSANSLGPTRSRDSQSVAFAPTSLLPAPIDRAVSFGHSLPPNPSSNDGYTSPLLRNIRKDRINTISASSSNASDNPHQNSSETFTSQLNPPNPTSFSTKHLVHHGVPYESLVNLGSMDSPYGLFSFSGGGGRRADVEISTIYSAASVLSVPHYARHHSHTTDPGVGGAAASVEKQQPPPLLSSRLSTRSEKDLVREAWLEFEEREEVAEAIPVRKRPDGVIEGKHGLVRSLILNDKQHVVTCDTAGVIAVWSIVFCRCVGLISSEEVLAAHLASSSADEHLTPREALELVKERIEGEAVTPTWCSVDTRIGGLTVHLEEGRCFDAEIHLDELGEGLQGSFKEDQRVSIGKLLITNIFAGFIQSSLQTYSTASSASATSNRHTATPSTGISRTPAPTHIPIHSLSHTASKPIPRSQTLNGSTTPGGISVLSALATPAMTPALAPDAADFFSLQHHLAATTTTPHPLRSIPQSPQSSTVPSTPGGSTHTPLSPARDSAGATVTGGGGGGMKDYFGSKGSGRPTSSGGMTSPGGAGETPGGGSFMGKLKGFGKGKKNATTPAASTLAPLADVSEEEAQRRADHEKYGSSISEHDLNRRRLLSALQTRGLSPPSSTDFPPLSLLSPTSSLPDPAIFVDEGTRDDGGWKVIYRGLASSTAFDREELEMSLPGWVLEFLLTGRGAVKEPVKMSFVLEPWDKQGGGLEELPNGNSRLTATRSLRMRKVCAYVTDRLQLGLPRSRAVSLSGNTPTPSQTHSPRFPSFPQQQQPQQQLPIQPPTPTTPANHISSRSQSPTHGHGSVIVAKPEECIELVCNGFVLPPKMTLAAVRQFVWRQGGDILIQYRRKEMGVHWAGESGL